MRPALGTSLFTAAALCVIAAAAGLSACTTCPTVACRGGVNWSVRSDDDAALAGGRYEITLELDDDRFVTTCTLEGKPSGDCEEFDTEGTDWAVTLVHFGEHPAVTGFEISAHAVAPEGADSNYSRGPRHFAVTLVGPDTSEPLLEDSHELSYERTHPLDDPDCGFCDELLWIERGLQG